MDKNFDGGRRGTGRTERLSEVLMPRGEGAKQLVHSDFTFLLVYSVTEFPMLFIRVYQSRSEHGGALCR